VGMVVLDREEKDLVVLDRVERDLSQVKDGQISETVPTLKLIKVIRTRMPSVAIVAVWVVSWASAVTRLVSGPPRFLVGIKNFTLALLAMVVESSDIVRISVACLQLSRRLPSPSWPSGGQIPNRPARVLVIGRRRVSCSRQLEVQRKFLLCLLQRLRPLLHRSIQLGFFRRLELPPCSRLSRLSLCLERCLWASLRLSRLRPLSRSRSPSSLMGKSFKRYEIQLGSCLRCL
jgi:hypothetical protein